ncbi:MFS transporter [Erwinia sp. E602]|uniref:MFS transporter n=1 Tax=Erwinia sp. E602 TaxID=2675378 RepID=UPI001BA511E5|nr:MFS transporter [Erwinia sp. E602]QUG73884.1 MFS transporter [Erwinia sp. E602]
MSQSSETGAFAPLKQGLFAMIWAATILGNTGSFMRDVASSWLVTGLSSNPAAVALMQTAATLPIFLLAIPAGVLSDILDRRRLLIFVQLLLASVSATLLILSQNNLLTVEYLVALTFIGGIGAALMGPAWQAIVPELVARPQLKNAVALNSLGINIARAVGPATGGLLLAALGAWAAYGADVLSYVFVIAALLLWKRPHKPQNELSEHFLGAFRAGIRYVKASRELHRVLLRSAIYFFFASAIWALLPLVARNLLQGTAGYYGVMLGAVGIGAIVGALLLPTLRQRMNVDGLMLVSALLSAAVMLLIALLPVKALALPLMVLLGVSWIIALTSLNGVAQSVLPDWVRGRGLAVYLMIFNGAMAAGSLFWGLVAAKTGLVATLLTAAVVLTLSAIICLRIKLPAGEADLQPSGHWDEPQINGDVTADRGPVMIQIEYRIAQEDRPAFLAEIKKLSLTRRRDGAYAWGIAEHSHDANKLIEWFLVESWHEHLRQHQRVSNADADLQSSVTRFHQGEEKPQVHHFISLH